MKTFKEFRTIVKSNNNDIESSIPIENSSDVLNYIVKDIDRSFLLTKNISKQLNELFGKWNKTIKGEFLNKVWILEFGLETYNVFCSNRGTSFELVGDRENVLNKKNSIISFLKVMEDLLKNNN